LGSFDRYEPSESLFGPVKPGINTTETRARYVIEDRVEKLMNLGFNTVYNKRIDELFITAGLNANKYKNRKYKEMNDLLGATFWIDVDQFAENLGVDESFQQNILMIQTKRSMKVIGSDMIIRSILIAQKRGDRQNTV